jgi:hypothetical protein
MTKDGLESKVSIKDYIDARLAAISTAVDKAEATLAVRLAGMNEFREQLKDQASRFITRDEACAIFKPALEDIRELRDFVATHRGKASQSSVLFLGALSISGFLLALLGIYLRISGK